MTTVSTFPVDDSAPDYKLRIDLDGTEFQFRFRFNEKEGFWYFDLNDADEVPIVEGVKVVIGLTLLRLQTDARRPLGEIMAIDTAGAHEEAGFAALGERVLLCYRSTQ